MFPGAEHSLEDLHFLRKHWDGPIVLKGIQHPADASEIAAMGLIDGIVVSNHGGRQADGGVSSLEMLPKIVNGHGISTSGRAGSRKVEVLFDSGIRSGADIAKAMALGAKMCLIGRPYVYGLALGGEEGVAHVLRSLLGDLELTLHLSGIRGVGQRQLNRYCLVGEGEAVE